MKCSYTEWDGSTCEADEALPYGVVFHGEPAVERLCLKHAAERARGGVLWLGKAHLDEREAIAWEVTSA